MPCCRTSFPGPKPCGNLFFSGKLSQGTVNLKIFSETVLPTFLKRHNLQFLISLKKLQFSAPKSGLVTSSQRVPAQTKKKKNWDNFLGANLQVCHPKGLFLNLGRPWTSPKGPFGTECGRKADSYRKNILSNLD
jgi:hypothetical protein